MSMTFRTQNALTTAKVEVTPGTDSAPTAGANAIRAEPAEWEPAFDTDQTDVARGGISVSPPIVDGGMAKMSIKSALMGSAAAGTTAPDIGTLLRGCAMSQTALAADVAGTAQAGAAGQITLAAGASAVDNFYRGLVIEVTGGTGSAAVGVDKRRVITGYTGASKIATVYPNWTINPDATTVYAIRKCFLYQPITVAQENLTLYSYLRNSAAAGLAKLHKVLGSMGNFDISIMPKKIGRISFNFQGQFPAPPTDVADPGTGTYVGVDPQPYIGAQTYLGGVAIKFNKFALSSGLKLANFDDPAQAYGNDTTEAVDRVGTGSITIPRSLNATQNAIQDWIGSVSKPLWLCWGPVGAGISIYIPALRYTGNKPTDSDGFAVEDAPFQLTGDDLEVLITYF